MLQRQSGRLTQFRAQLSQPLVAALEGIRLRRVSVDDQRDGAREVVNHRQLFGQQQQDVWYAKVIRLGMLLCEQAEPWLDKVRGFKAEVAREPPRKARQAGHGGDLELRLEGSDVVQRIGNGLLARPEWRDVSHLVAAHLDAGAGAQADEAVAAEPLTAHHRFQQEGVAVVGEFEVNR